MYYDIKNDGKLRDGIIGDDKKWNNKEWMVYSFMKLSPHIVLADTLLGLNVPSAAYIYMGTMMIFILLGKETLDAIVRHKLNVEQKQWTGTKTETRTKTMTETNTENGNSKSEDS